LALTIDGKAKRESLEDHPLGRLSNFGNTVGNGFIEVGAAGGMFLTGQLSEDKKLADTGIATLEALLINGVATEGLKYAVGRQRPNGQGDKMSFPSGHVSMTATLAASVSEMYDWDLRLAIPLYATVAVVGIARMDSNMHYLSDVLAGLTLGTLIGSSFAKYHKEKTAEQKISFSPVYEKDFKGILFSYQF
jgi:membrane-associated phospholipid phosphatase